MIYTYAIINVTTLTVKVGKSCDPRRRLHEFELMFKEQDFVLARTWRGDCELDIHRKFAKDLMFITEETGWYPDLMDSREVFNLTLELIEALNL